MKQLGEMYRVFLNNLTSTQRAGIVMTPEYKVVAVGVERV